MARRKRMRWATYQDQTATNPGCQVGVEDPLVIAWDGWLVRLRVCVGCGRMITEQGAVYTYVPRKRSPSLESLNTSVLSPVAEWITWFPPQSSHPRGETSMAEECKV